MVSPLETAAQAMALDPDGGRLQFFRIFADTPLLLLLNAEAEAEVLSPRIFDLPEGRVVLAFESDTLLAALGDGPLPYAELPGRVLARLLAAEGLGLGLNLGSGLSTEQLLPATAMTWLSDLLSDNLEARRGNFDKLSPPDKGARDALGLVFATAPQSWNGQAQAARLYSQNQGLVLIIEGAEPAAEEALAQAVAEALRTCDLGGRVVDIAFAHSDAWPAGAARYDWPQKARAPETPGPATKGPTAPGLDPARPPILR